MRRGSQARRQQPQQPGKEAAPPADNNDNDATPPPPPTLNNVDDDEFPSDYFARPLDEDINQALKRCIIDNRVLGEVPDGYGRADDKILPTFEQLRKFKSPRVRLRPIQQRQQQGEQSVSTDDDTLHSNMEGLSTNTMDVNLVDELPPYTPPIRDLKQFPKEYYDSQDVYIATFRRILNALIKRSKVMKKLCENLQRDDDGNIIIDVHPIFANGVNLQGDSACTIIVGHYASVRQGKKGVMTESGEGTCLTFNQLLAAARTVDPSFTLRNFGFSEDVLPLKFGFENTKGEKFLATRDVLDHLTEEETNDLNAARTNYYCQLFVSKMRQGNEEFRIVFYGEGKRLRPLFEDAFRQAEVIMRENSSEMGDIHLDKIKLKMKEVPHWGSVIYPISTEQKELLDAGVAFLLGVGVEESTYFQDTDFTHLQYCGKGSGGGMLACLLAILKGNSSAVLLDTILNSNVDETNPRYSRRFDIADATVLSSLGSYLGLHSDAILVFINSELNDASIEITREELTVRHLAQYLSFRRWGDMSEEQREAAMQPALRAMAEKREGMSEEQRLEAMQPAIRAMAEKREGMTPEEILISMCLALRALAEKREANRAYYVCTIYNEAVLIDKALTNFRFRLGIDTKATVKAVTAAITKYGYYSHFGDVNCKFGELEDWIERAPKDQRDAYHLNTQSFVNGVNNNADNRRAMKNWSDLRNKMRSGWCVVTIHDRVVLMNVLAHNPMSVKTLLGWDQKATAKAITAASKIDGYSYFGDVNCKVFKLEDWIERATKDQRDSIRNDVQSFIDDVNNEDNMRAIVSWDANRANRKKNR